MADAEGPFWTIDELGTRVGLALSVNYEGQASGKVPAGRARPAYHPYTPPWA